MAIVLIALGSNRCHGRHGRPAGVVRAAMAALPHVVSVSPIFSTAPLGPGTRRYANAVAAIAWPGDLWQLLALLQAIERDFGRRRGRRWGDRVLDLDIVAAGARPGSAAPGAGAAAVCARSAAVGRTRLAASTDRIDRKTVARAGTSP
jgi:2-amino-4-hydroxy-6-hydroxymethyldihydropteridine diphosphokinase